MPKTSHPVDKVVGKNIRIFRTARRMSQTELGKGVDVTFQQIQKYEKGTSRVGPGRLSQIATILNVPIYRFFEDRAKGRHGRQSGPVVTDLLDGPYAVKLLQAFSKIASVRLRRDLLSLIETCATQMRR